MIEWDRVNELRSEIGDDDFAEVVTMFLEESDEIIAQTKIGIDAKTLESNLHFLKGAALNLGFADFAAICQIGERRAASGSVDVDLVMVADSYYASKRALEAGQPRSEVA